MVERWNGRKMGLLRNDTVVRSAQRRGALRRRGGGSGTDTATEWRAALQTSHTGERRSAPSSRCAVKTRSAAARKGTREMRRRRTRRPGKGENAKNGEVEGGVDSFAEAAWRGGAVETVRVRRGWGEKRSNGERQGGSFGESEGGGEG